MDAVARGRGGWGKSVFFCPSDVLSPYFSEKNYKKANPKLTQKMTPNLTPNSTPKKDSRHDDICVSQRIEHLGGKCTK
jgi:hypothetical protein